MSHNILDIMQMESCLVILILKRFVPLEFKIPGFLICKQISIDLNSMVWYRHCASRIRSRRIYKPSIQNYTVEIVNGCHFQ
jgi:hypothetical protein